MKVLLTGASGQLGNALVNSSPLDVDLITLDRSRLDLADPKSCRQSIFELRPDWVLNAGAYTSVDKAEREPELAYAVNAGAPEAFAEALAEVDGRLLQISTDFVFNGRQSYPYGVDQSVDPLGVYGASKAAGEKAALQLPGARLLRTSWVYGSIGQNFCLTMLNLHASKAAKGEPLQVVADQVGCPTATQSLALACWRSLFLKEDSNQIRRLHWCDAGVASWYDFAVAIGELAVGLGLLSNTAVVKPIKSSEYPVAAKRPNYSVLDCDRSAEILNLDQPYWRTSLAQVLRQLL